MPGHTTSAGEHSGTGTSIAGMRPITVSQKPEVVEKHRSVVSESPKFNWIALLVWLSSLLISLVPLIISAGQYYKENDTIDFAFWAKALFDDDVMWVFATVLLFCLVNQMIRALSAKQTCPPSAGIIALTILGLVVFIFSEALWIMVKLLQFDNSLVWPVAAGGILVAVITMIATPLQINFIKEGE